MIADLATINEVSGRVVDAAVKVHAFLGPGLLESSYRRCLSHELRKRGLDVDCEIALPIRYDGVRLDAGYRIDMRVHGCVLVEVKAVSQLLPLHQAQLLTYLKLSGIRVGLLLNFHVPRMRDGITRLING